MIHVEASLPHSLSTFKRACKFMKVEVSLPPVPIYVKESAPTNQLIIQYEVS